MLERHAAGHLHSSAQPDYDEDKKAHVRNQDHGTPGRIRTHTRRLRTPLHDPPCYEGMSSSEDEDEDNDDEKNGHEATTDVQITILSLVRPVGIEPTSPRVKAAC